MTDANSRDHERSDPRRGTCAAHDVLMRLLDVLVEYSPDVETWYGDSSYVGDDPEIIDSVHRELLVSWRAKHDRAQMLAEIALDVHGPWANLSPPVISEATRSIYDYLKQIRDFRRYVAEAVKQGMYTSDEDLDELNDFYIAPALQDVRRFQRGMRLLRAPRFPLPVQIDEEAKPQQSVSGPTSTEDASRAETAPEPRKDQRQIPEFSTRGHTDFRSLDTAAFAVAHWVTDDCLNRLARFLRSESLSVLIHASHDTQAAIGHCPWQEQLRLLWLDAFDTLRRVAAVVLFDINDPLDVVTNELVQETRTYLFDFAEACRDFRKIVQDHERSDRDGERLLHNTELLEAILPKSPEEWASRFLPREL